MHRSMRIESGRRIPTVTLDDRVGTMAESGRTLGSRGTRGIFRTTFCLFFWNAFRIQARHGVH